MELLRTIWLIAAVAGILCLPGVFAHWLLSRRQCFTRTVVHGTARPALPAFSLITLSTDSARGDTATSVFKLATIETGAEVKVPGHIKKGDKVKIRTADGEFMGRVN